MSFSGNKFWNEDVNVGAVLGLFALIVLVVILLRMFLDHRSSDNPPNSPDHMTSAQMAVYREAEEIVREGLLTPSRAEFPDAIWDLDPRRAFTVIGSITYHDDEYEIRGNVDSQNLAGAMLRKHWTCKAKKISDEKWEIIAGSCGVID
jgi:hypothetical protein